MKIALILGFLSIQASFCFANTYIAESSGTNVVVQQPYFANDTAWSSTVIGSCSTPNPSVVTFVATGSSYILAIANWGLGSSIPSGSTIDGVTVTITRGVSGVGAAGDEAIVIIRSITDRGQDIYLTTDPNPWSSTASAHTYNEATGISYTDINNAAFGVGIRVIGAGITARVVCVSLNVSYTPPPITSAAITSAPVTTGAITTGALTSGDATTSPLTSAQLTTSPLTSSPLTTQSITSGAITSGAVTSGAITSGAVTSADITSSPLTTAVAGATTAPAAVTTGEVTSSPLTSSPLTTSPLTTARLTTGTRVTTGNGPTPTTGAITSGARTSGALTSAALTTSEVTSAEITTSAVTSSPITSASVTSGASVTSTSGGVESSPSEGGRGSMLAVAIAVPVAIGAVLIIAAAAIIVTKRRQAAYRAQKRMASSYPEVIQELGLAPPKPPAMLNAVKQVGVSSDQNSLYRRTMEDEHIFVDKFAGVENQFYIGVYDGHGGRIAAEKVKASLHEAIAKELKSGKSKPDAFNAAFAKVDDEIKSTGEKSGSTAAVAIITVEDGKKKLYTANSGDARIVLKRGKTALRMTIDHKATDPDEQKRIKDMGGLILGDKVGASLAVTRAFGDAELKEWVKAEPYIKSVDLNPEDSHLIVACDGLWDVLSDQEAVDQIVPTRNAQEISDKLLKLSLEKGTKDNVSILVVQI